MSWRCGLQRLRGLVHHRHQVAQAAAGQGRLDACGQVAGSEPRAIAVMRVIGRRMARSVSNQAERNRPNATAASSAVSRA